MLKKVNKNILKQWLVIIYTFTVQLYNIYTLKYSEKKRKSCSPTANACTVFKWKGRPVWFLCTQSIDWTLKDLNSYCNIQGSSTQDNLNQGTGSTLSPLIKPIFRRRQLKRSNTIKTCKQMWSFGLKQENLISIYWNPQVIIKQTARL